MSRRPGHILAVLLGAVAACVLAAAWSPRPAAAAVAVYTPPTSTTPVATFARFQCSLRRSRSGRLFSVRSTPAGVYRLNASASFSGPNQRLPLPFRATPIDARAYFTAPRAVYTNVNAGPPDRTVAGAFSLRGTELFDISATIYDTAGNGARIGGSGRCGPEDAAAR